MEAKGRKLASQMEKSMVEKDSSEEEDGID